MPVDGALVEAGRGEVDPGLQHEVHLRLEGDGLHEHLHPQLTLEVQEKVRGDHAVDSLDEREKDRDCRAWGGVGEPVRAARREGKKEHII